MSKLAIYPGSFDPITYGHIDLINRSSKIFDSVIIGVAIETQKETLFNIEERMEMVREVTKDLGNVEPEAFTGLVINFAQNKGANVLVRGLRMISDFEYELQMAMTNRRLDEKIETVFLMPSESNSFLSSTLIKEAAQLGADLSSFVPEFVAERLKEKLTGTVNR